MSTPAYLSQTEADDVLQQTPICPENSPENLSRRLIDAAIAGLEDIVVALLNHPDTNAGAGWSGDAAPFWTADEPDAALRGAAAAGHERIVDILLQNKDVDVSASDHAALRVAARLGHTGVVQRLLLNEVVREAVPHGDALAEACKAGHLDIVRQLLPFYDRMAGSFTALVLACGNGHLQITELLLNRLQDNPDLMEITIPHAMQACAQHGNAKIMELLLSINGADPSINNSSVLVIACKHRHIGIVRLLLADNRVDASTADLLPIRVAASAGASDIVSLLLANHHVKRMVQSDAQVIKSALIFGRTKVVAQLLWNRAAVPKPDALGVKRVQHVMQTADRMLQRERQLVAWHTLTLAKANVANDVADEILVLIHSDRIHGDAKRDKKQDIGKIRSRISFSFVSVAAQ